MLVCTPVARGAVRLLNFKILARKINMENCFVIQPFDDKYNKRYKDIYEPAIINAGLNPYRVDQDLSTRVPIDNIEEGIQDSAICFADISTNNPNVWYELGFAFAAGKDVIMICSEEREGKFPFDIQHRHIIKYSIQSKSDFEELENKITSKIQAYLSKKKKVKKLSKAKLIDSEGLNDHEMSLLALIFEEQTIPNTDVAIFGVKNDMEKIGYTNIATGMALRTLRKKEMIETHPAFDEWNNHEFEACGLTEKGESWMIENQDKFEFTLSEEENIDDDLPF
jgi:hypothetical protein